MSNKPTVFLSGPMRGLSREVSLGWRKQAEELLKDKFVTMRALRGREDHETIPDSRAAIARDKSDILKADILLVNDLFENASMIGTAMETIFAWEAHKIVIIFGEAHVQDYWLNYHAHMRCTSLEEACEILNTLFC